jgi:predicted dehydrogenase
MSRYSRRSFVKTLAAGGAAAVAALQQVHAAEQPELLDSPLWKPASANDRIRIAAVGAGIMGFNNMRSALMVPGVELAAVSDLYDGRMLRAKEAFGNQLITTRDYRELISRPDIDAVLVSTSDHWHDRITIDALNAGKHVYCEKPMVNLVEKGAAVLAAEQKSGKVLQVGSQVFSSIATEKARTLYESGAIGKLVMIETYNDRDSANGAWQYSIPTDASEKTVDWDRFLGDAPKRPFDKTRFFRWRNYRDYGTGAAGDLFVHLFTRFHKVTSSLGPERAYATGGLHFWKDGRDVPDVIMGLYDYPETPAHPAFHVQMRVNFVSGGGGAYLVKLVGTEGIMIIDGDTIRIDGSGLQLDAPYGGWDSYETFAEAERKAYAEWYDRTHPKVSGTMRGPGERVYSAPENYSDHYHHFFNFFNAIRTQDRSLIEDGAFGMRAAGPALLANLSYFERKVVRWDPKAMKLV